MRERDRDYTGGRYVSSDKAISPSTMYMQKIFIQIFAFSFAING